MNPEYTSGKNYRYGQYEGYESRCQRRLREHLGVDEAAAEAIIHLRSQIVALQSRIRQLEIELTAKDAGQQNRLARYREVYYEVAWTEVEFQE